MPDGSCNGRKCDCGLCEIARGAIYNLRLYRREIHYQEPPSPFEVQAAWDETLGNIRGEEAREQEERDKQRDAAPGGATPRGRKAKVPTKAKARNSGPGQYAFTG